MKASLRNRWIRALRSGKYLQIQERLGNSGKGRCCLGVLCDIIDYNFTPSPSGDGDGDVNKEAYTKINLLIGESNSSELSYKNDKGSSFKKIADWIKENL